jgi:hypothetical protein
MMMFLDSFLPDILFEGNLSNPWKANVSKWVGPKLIWLLKLKHSIPVIPEG